MMVGTICSKHVQSVEDIVRGKVEQPFDLFWKAGICTSLAETIIISGQYKKHKMQC